MIVRLVLASLLRRSRQLVLILTAVTVAAATVATLAGFSARAQGRLGADLAAFGPNLVVRSQVGGPQGVAVAALGRVRAVPGVGSALGVSGAPAPETARFDRIEVRAQADRLEEVARAIEARVEGIEARPLLRTSESDARLTRRLLLVLAAVSGVSLLLALISVGAATTALMGERRTEIGLFLALGYTGRKVGVLLAAELLAAALVAAVLGELLGEMAASGLARELLGSTDGLSVTWSGFLAAALAAVVVVGFSMTLALRRVERLDAARVLRGE